MLAIYWQKKVASLPLNQKAAKNKIDNGLNRKIMNINLTIRTRSSSAATFGKLLKVVARRHQLTLTHTHHRFSLSICRLGNMSFSYRTEEKSGEITLVGHCCTTPAGPGFHKEAVELADEITDLNGYDFHIEDETGFYGNNDFGSLRNNYFLPWLRGILSLCRRQKDGEYLSLAVGWDDEVYLPSDRKGLLITPLGFFNISSLLARLKHPGGLEGFADEFFVWPHEERDALFYRNSALNALWEDCCFMPSERSAEDKETNAFILDNLEQAARLDSHLPFPKEEYLKLCECAECEPIDLSGLPETALDAATTAAKEKGLEGWLFTLHAPSYNPFMTYADNRELRQKMYMAKNTICTRGSEYDNTEIVKRIVNLRRERAQLLGSRTFADFVLQKRMAENSQNVYQLLNDLLQAYLPTAREEVKAVEAAARKREGADFVLQPWDFGYYAHKLQLEKYNIDGEMLRPYFELARVKQGVFGLATRLYGITFKENPDIPVYHPDVTAYEVYDKDGTFLAVLYADFHPRKGKQSGAWMTSYKDQWIDDDDDMQEGDLEGDIDNDCLMIDRNKDGQYGGYGDLIVDWVGADDAGNPAMQVVVDNIPEADRMRTGNGHYMWVIDTDKDNVFNYIDWNTFTLRCWIHNGMADFYEDYNGKSTFLKIHSSTERVNDVRMNWENPFLFYDPDNDGLTEMAIRFCDSPKIVKDEKQANSVLSGKIDWVSISMDPDNDNAPGNEVDFDMTIHFTGPGFSYENQRHVNKNLRGLPEADQFFLDARWRQLPELLYPDHDAAWDLVFQQGKWDKAWFTYDEDDDCNRWERVELYQPGDPFKVGRNKGGIDSNGQADPAGDRGEWDSDNSGKGQLYVSPMDGKIHLYGAEWGCWRIDQNARYYQGMGGIYDGYGPQRIEREPTVFPTIKYTDTDNNGFFDRMDFDLDGDKQFERYLSMKELELDDRCPLIETAVKSYQDFAQLEQQVADAMWANAEKAMEVAAAKKLNTQWYALMKQPKSQRERYHYGFWLQFYLYNDLKDLAERTGDTAQSVLLDKAYLQGKWELIK